MIGLAFIGLSILSVGCLIRFFQRRS